MNKGIVGKFKDDLSRIEFFNILLNINNYTILEKQTFDMMRFYIWDNKDKKFGIIKTATAKGVNWNDLIKNYTDWYDGNVLFFYADSKFVTEYGFQYYDNLIGLYQQILDITKTALQEKQILKHFKEKSLKEFLVVYFKTLKHRRMRNRFLREAERELKIIW